MSSPSMRFAACARALLVACLAAAPAALGQEVARVGVVAVQEQSLVEEVPLTGTVTSPRISLLSVEVAGLISDIRVDAGDRVRAGELLLQLDTHLGEIDVASARASANGAEANWKNSKRRLLEARALVEKRNISASEVLGLEAQAEIDAAAFEAAAAEARRQEAELRRHRIHAPFDGTISRKLAEVGEWLSPGSQVLELVATDGLRLDFQVPQRFYPRINERTRLVVRFDGHPGQSFPAKVSGAVPLSNNSARTFLLRARLAEGSVPLIIPGMSANAVLQLDVDGTGITAPRDALLRHPDGRISVWVIDRHDVASGNAEVREQRVRTGLAFGTDIEILSGLKPGQMVVTRGNEALRAGQKVLIEAPSPSAGP